MCRKSKDLPVHHLISKQVDFTSYENKHIFIWRFFSDQAVPIVKIEKGILKVCYFHSKISWASKT